MPRESAVSVKARLIRAERDVRILVNGPWPPYTFATSLREECTTNSSCSRTSSSMSGGRCPSRIDVDAEGVEQGLAQLVLTLVEFLRQLLERQAVRRMEGGSLSDEEVERVGLALMKLEEKVHQLADQFGLRPSDLNINLGPLGDLL